MTPQSFTSDLLTGLGAQCDAANAATMHAYQRKQFAFAGVKTPARRQIATPLIRAARQSFDEADYVSCAMRLWAEPWRECQYVAVDLLCDHARHFGPDMLAVLDTLIGSKSWWDTNDALASNVLGPLLRHHPQLLADIDDWAAGERLWHARCAILHQLRYGAQTDSARLFGYCRQQAGHPDFFMQKAIGWALRQYCRHDAEAVTAFVAGMGSALSSLSRREALRHQPD
ncbi:DNA alkylation repair protein [Chitinilyticum aquatile]|uniref:DNA alkylation repair protein n=1 Tax=Chitinilyticum aquatile TaxID=362520 RepID=UPI0004134747|nr:DNA alkylation repair protein [Chitinilyticum aquatile]